MKGLYLCVLLAATLALSGCAALEGMVLTSHSAPALEWTPEEAAVVSRHLVQALILSYPTDTIFSLGGAGPFKGVVEAQMRESGYAIFADVGESAHSAESLELTCEAGVVSSEDGTAPVWASLATEDWRVDGLFVRGEGGRLKLSGGLTMRGR